MPVLLCPLAPPTVASIFHHHPRPLRHPRLLELPIFHLFLFLFQPLSLTMGPFLQPLHLPMSILVHNLLPPSNLLNWQYPSNLLALRTPFRVLTIESMVQGTRNLQLPLLPESYLVLAWAVRTILKRCPIQTQFLLRHPTELQHLCPHLPRSSQLRTKK